MSAIEVDTLPFPSVASIYKELERYTPVKRFVYRVYANENYIYYSWEHESIGVFKTLAEAKNCVLEAAWDSADTAVAVRFALEQPDKARELLDRFNR